MTTRLQKATRRQGRHNRQVARRLEKKRLLQATTEDDDPVVATATIPAGTYVATPDPDEEDEDLEDEEDDTQEAEPVTRARVVHSDDPEEVPALSAKVQKDYGYGYATVEQAPMGPTSWDELDAAVAAQEQSDEIRHASYNVEDLVRNILNHPIMDASEKATAIQDVGAGFQERVDSILSGDNAEPMKKDIDLLELEALIAIDRRQISVGERMSDFLTKAKLSYASKKAMPDSAYALVVNRDGKKVRKYLIHDKAHVRNALARAAQQMKAGGQGGSDAKAALPKIHAAAKRMGIGMGKERGVGGVIVQKDGHGDWRWVGWPSNNFIDWQGDIISKEAHQEYVQFLDANPGMAPLFCSWHTDGTERVNRPDYWAYDNGFLIMSGKLEEAEAAALFKAQAATDLGMSLRGFGLRESKDPRVITKYRAFEVSDLPLEDAANPFTDLSLIVKEVDVDKKKYLATLLGSEDKAEAFMQGMALKQKELDAAGVESKAKDAPATEPVPAAAPVAVAQVTAAVTKAQEAAPGDVKAIVDAVIKELQIDDLNKFVEDAQEAMDKVPVLEGLIKDMQENADQKLADKITPPASRFAWARKERASAADATVVKADDELAKKAPELGDNWLSAATGTVPIEAESVRA